MPKYDEERQGRRRLADARRGRAASGTAGRTLQRGVDAGLVHNEPIRTSERTRPSRARCAPLALDWLDLELLARWQLPEKRHELRCVECEQIAREIHVDR